MGEKHIDLVHSKSTKQLIFCQHCDMDGRRVNQELGSLYSLKRHLTRHKCPLVTKAGEECSTCSKDPETYYKLRNHIKVNDNKKVLPCDQCDKKFKTMQDLTTQAGHRWSSIFPVQSLQQDVQDVRRLEVPPQEPPGAGRSAAAACWSQVEWICRGD